ncbi:hypothetical protein ElyMa_004704800 [Elysia marginata]|uniref:Uncharacterized protein n=1 Tax=Elysia marginata TaxID=1093978 RepID=A0AAV4IBH2_9GAST|nr:hypothetical protein ElyMa_004704800 [Elysia marginata]
MTAAEYSTVKISDVKETGAELSGYAIQCGKRRTRVISQTKVCLFNQSTFNGNPARAKKNSVIKFYALQARSGGRSPQRRKFKMADEPTASVIQSSAVKPTLLMGVITSYVIVIGAQGLYCKPL